MNTGGGRRQQQAPQPRVATAPLNLEPRPTTMRHDDSCSGLPDPCPTAALARRVSPDRHAAPSRVHRECCLSKARS
jgi:hypothetical protein